VQWEKYIANVETKDQAVAGLKCMLGTLAAAVATQNSLKAAAQKANERRVEAMKGADAHISQLDYLLAGEKHVSKLTLQLKEGQLREAFALYMRHRRWHNMPGIIGGLPDASAALH
jgi:hypothetical protein